MWALLVVIELPLIDDTAAKLVQTQDARGAWVEPAYFRARSKMPAGASSISCRTFATNIMALAQYIAATPVDKP
jgi:hypothetical protein